MFGDADAYMQKGEKEAAMKNDPVPLFRAWLLAQGHASEAQLSALETGIDKEIDAAVEFALSSPNPGLEELQRDVLAEVSA